MKQRLRMLWIPLVILLAVSIVSAVIFYRQGSMIAAASSAMICLSSAVLCVMNGIISKNVTRYVTTMDRSLATILREEFYDYPSPIVVADPDKMIIWYNKSFEQNIFSEDRVYGIPLSELIGANTSKFYSDSGAVVKILDKHYRVKAIEHDTGLSIVSFTDCSAQVALEQEYRMSRKTVMYIAVDNYEEVLQNSKESDKAGFRAEIEKLFERFIESTNGILHRLSSDRFYCILEERHLAPIIERRFDILDEARSISLGERSNVTLSIGVGRGARDLRESEKFARQALDMCLGRGGDQAAVKTESGFEFFGGVSKGVEKSAKVKTRVIAAALSELVSNSRNIYIMGHHFADFDAVGASVGLCGAFRSMGKSVWVVVDPEKNLAKSLIDHIRANGGSDYFKTIPEARLELSDQDLLIICDTHNPEILDSKELYEQAKQTVVIDHHRMMVNHIDNAVVFFHEPFASSACEMSTELIQYFGPDCKISVAEAEALLCGIMLDTKNFVMRSGARTFEAAAYLKKLGADTVTVKRLFSDSLETYREKSKLIQEAKLFHGCAIAATDSDAPELRLAAPQAADDLLGIVGVKASFVIYRSGGICYISARSLDSFNVQLIMEAVGGGGHQTMAGAQIEATVDEAVDKVKNAIEDFLIKS